MFQRAFGAILEPIRGETHILGAKKVLRVLKLKVSKGDHSSTSKWKASRYFGMNGKLKESRLTSKSNRSNP